MDFGGTRNTRTQSNLIFRYLYLHHVVFVKYQYEDKDPFD